MAKRGWSERQYRKAKKAIREWPKWLRPNLKVRTMVEAEKRAIQHKSTPPSEEEL